METFVTILIIGGILYLIYILKISGVKLDDAAIGVDNPYRDNSMPLSNYEKELDAAFNYECRTIPLNKEEKDDEIIHLGEEIIKKDEK